MTNNELALRNTMRSEKAVSLFQEFMPEASANAYISSVMLAARMNPALLECQPLTILESALRSATLGLSVDPGIGQAYLVPFKGKCTLIVGYKGLKKLAINTGQVRHLEVEKLYEGEELQKDRIKQVYTITQTGKLNKENVVGYFGVLILKNGYSEIVQMSIDEIIEHKEKYSKGHNRPDSPWNTEFDKMAKKTVLRRLILGSGILDPNIVQIIENEESEEDDNFDMVDVEIIEESPEPPKASAHLTAELTGEPMEMSEAEYFDYCSMIELDETAAFDILKESGNNPAKAYNTVRKQYNQ